jgi:solute:Na+ symporter, SSS family
VEFYRLVRPPGPGWTRIREQAGVGPSPDSLAQSFLGWVMGCVFVYSALFGAGSYLYGHLAQGAFWTVAFGVSGAWLLRLLMAR